MQRTPNILIVSPDSRLEAEVASALKGLEDTSAVLHYAAEHRQGLELARSRRPELCLVEMTKDLRALKSFAQELAVASPETSLAAAFAPDIFGPDVSESAIIIEAIRLGLQDFLRRPLSRPDLSQLLERLHKKTVAVPVSIRAGKIVSFASNKGGVGKSTIAVNVACGLAQRHPEQVLLIDASLQMGVGATLLDLKPATTLTDAAREQDRLDETLLRQLATPHECGVHLLAAPSNPVESAEIDDVIMARVLTLARRAYDFVIVDSFPLLDRVMMAVLDLSDRVYVVLESVVPTVLGAAQLLKLLESLGLPKELQRLVLNRYTGSTDNLKPADVALRLGRPIDHVFPYQKKVPIASNLGRPYILGTSRLWGLGRALNQLVAEVEAMPFVRHARPEATPAEGRGRETSPTAPSRETSPTAPSRETSPSANGTPNAAEVQSRE